MGQLPDCIQRPVARDGANLIYKTEAQQKGLRQESESKLMRTAYQDGYGNYVDRLVEKWSIQAVFSEWKKQKNNLVFADIGGGHGNFFNNVSAISKLYLNIEPSRTYEALDRKTSENEAKYFKLLASAENIPIRDSEVDMALCLATLDHIPNPKQAILEIKRILKPGGLLVFTLNNKDSWWKRMLHGSKLLAKREDEILKDHHFLWGPNDAEREIGSEIPLEKLTTICHCPQLPLKTWKLAAKILNPMGSLIAPRLGSNIVATFRNPGA